MKRVSLFGYGNTTKALAKEFDNVVFYDDKCHKPFVDENGYKVKPSYEFNPNYSDLEIPSPGIAPSNLLIQKAKNLISEYDYFANTTPLKVWISGTNGKTTTTQMMHHLLKDKDAEIGGNIGNALATLNKQSAIWLLETSSFTLHYTNKATPNIYILLPITPDHLSWHGSMQEYTNAKLKPLTFMKEGDIALIPKEFVNTPSDALVIGYDNAKDLADYFSIELDKIDFEGAFLVDALLAMAIDKILFDRIDYAKINSFKVEAHRQEEITDAKGRVWVNDSKATNIDATLVALKRYAKKKIFLILGGDDKGVDLTPLFESMKNYNLTLFTIGSNKEKLFKLAQDFSIEAIVCQNLEDSIKKIDSLLDTKSIALLSPAAASLDEFNSYAHRGDVFKDKIQSLS